MNIEKQIRYWLDGASSDFEAAEALVQNGKFLQGLFFCHLVVEKALKAHVTKVKNEVPPKSHNLNYLSERAEVEIPGDIRKFFGVLTRFQLEGRYPGYHPEIPSNKECDQHLQKTKEILEWLTRIL